VTSNPSIAVIVPNRNDSCYLPRCLRSVLDQEVPPDELIIVDDGSTDDSVAVIRSVIAGEPRARLLVSETNVGTLRAVEVALRDTRSEYVLFLSANDAVLPGIFSRAKRCLAQSPGAGLWSALVWLVDEEDRPIRLHLSPVAALNDTFFPPERCVELAYRFGNWFTGTTLIYRRQALREAGGFDVAYGASSDLITALVIASRWGAAYSPEPFAVIRMHPGSYGSRWLKDVVGLETMFGRLRAHGPQLPSRLFSEAFLERTAFRLRFAAVRESGGEAIVEIASRLAGSKRVALLATDRLIPAKHRRLRIALGFVILRPFDILPTLWNRMLGWVFVRLRLLVNRK
jgi:glycosyltransferase involved in cell wall biosynthesis